MGSTNVEEETFQDLNTGPYARKLLDPILYVDNRTQNRLIFQTRDHSNPTRT